MPTAYVMETSEIVHAGAGLRLPRSVVQAYLGIDCDCTPAALVTVSGQPAGGVDRRSDGRGADSGMVSSPHGTSGCAGTRHDRHRCLRLGCRQQPRPRLAGQPPSGHAGRRHKGVAGRRAAHLAGR